MVLLSHFNDVSLGTCFPDQLQNNGRHQRYIYIGMFSISMVCSWKLHGMAILLYNNLLMFSLKLGYSYVWVCTRYYTVKCFSIGNLRSKAFCQKFYQRLWHIFKSYTMAGLCMNWDNIFSWILNFTKNFVKMISPNCPEI